MRCELFVLSRSSASISVAATNSESLSATRCRRPIWPIECDVAPPILRTRSAIIGSGDDLILDVMHLLYVDDSGSAGDPQERFFVLAGVAVFERRLYHLITALDQVVEGFGLDLEEAHQIELHGSAMYSGHKDFHSIKRAERETMIHAALDVIADKRAILRLFAVVVDKQFVSPREPVEFAFEEISNRFNLFLQRINDANAHEQSQRGLIVMDESAHEGRLQSLARHFRVNGARWGHFKNLAAVPLFVDSRASRCIQLADLVAWATWRKYEHQDGRFFDKLIPKFDADGGVIHGLVHHRRRDEPCYCPACHSRRLGSRSIRGG
jgi:hypothetical protein